MTITLPHQTSAPGEAIECWAQVDGYRMRYLRAGSGPPLILLHGLLGYSFSWRMNISALAPYATVYAPDLLGIGFSDRPPGLDCSMRAAAGRILGFMDAVGIRQADVLGTSHGGGVTAMLAAMDADAGSQRIRRLILVAPVNPWSDYGRGITDLLASKPGGLALSALLPILRRLRWLVLARLYGDWRRIPPGSAAGYGAGVAAPSTIDYLLGVMRCWHDDLNQLESAYPRISGVPSLLVWGTRDPVVWPSSAAHLHSILSHSELVFLEGAGHLPYEEAPNEFNQAVLRFLAG